MQPGRIRSPLKSSRSGMTWIEVLVVIAILMVLIVLLISAIQEARRGRTRTGCYYNMKQIGLAQHEYLDAHGTFAFNLEIEPETGLRHSWRTSILPYMDNGPLWDRVRFDLPWDHPENQQCSKIILMSYMCRDDEEKNQPGMPRESWGSYVVLTGPDTIYGASPPLVPEDITDGTAYTVLATETTDKFHWMQPYDTTPDHSYEEVAQGTKSTLPHETGNHVLMADGSMRCLNKKIDRDIWRALTTANGGEDELDDHLKKMRVKKLRWWRR